MLPLVVEPQRVETIAAAIARAPLVAFDLEFLAQERLVPALCLVQVAWTPHEALDAAPIADASPELALVDPLAVDVRPIVDAIAAEGKRIFEAPDVQKSLFEVGAVASPMTPDNFVAFISAERKKWHEVVEAAGVQLQ